jgi:phosphatidylserine/phosphatidylglycerophosphate/cardiolipin synthase-like enzyme
MREDITFHDGKVMFFKESNFWDELLSRVTRETGTIYIATYNFNFNQYPRSFYEKLVGLANVGVDVRLLYATMTNATSDNLEVEEVFKNFVLCAQLEANHSKLFITDDFAFVGSANFSFGSNRNYESGVIFENKEIVEKIAKYYRSVLLENSEFLNVPQSFDPFVFLRGLLSATEDLRERELEEMYEEEIREIIPELRYLEDLKKYFKELNYLAPPEYDWFKLVMQLYDKEQVHKVQFEEFKRFLDNAHEYLTHAISFIDEQYRTIGRLELLKKAKVIKE